MTASTATSGLLITFTDGSSETAEGTSYAVLDGVLTIWDYRVGHEHATSHYPVANIRNWRELR